MRIRALFVISLFGIYCFCYACKKRSSSVNSEMPIVEEDNPSLKDEHYIKCNSFNGFWGFQNDNKDLSFRVRLHQRGDSIWGQYCAAAYQGNRLDCSFDTEYNIRGNMDGDSAKVQFYSFYGAKGGVASIRCSNDTLLWKIIKWPSGEQVFAPQIARLYQLEDNY